MIKELDNFKLERKSIQEKFNSIIKFGLSDDFMKYYDNDLKDERYDIDQNCFEVYGATDSQNIFPRLKQVIENGTITLQLDEGRCDFKFFLKDTKEYVPNDRKWKWGGYFYVYRYITLFCNLELDECIYLYKLSNFRKGAFFFYEIADESSNFITLIRNNKNIKDDVIESLELFIRLAEGEKGGNK